MEKKKLAIKVIGVIVICFIVLVALGAFGKWYMRRSFRGDFLPSDAELIEQFQNTREDMERLRQMVKEDKLTAPINQMAGDSNRISEERLKEYRRVLRRVDLFSVSGTVHGDETIWFTVEITGFLDGGASKGFVYLLDDLRGGRIVPSLDSPCYPWDDRGQGDCRMYRQINKDWWLYRTEIW